MTLSQENSRHQYRTDLTRPPIMPSRFAAVTRVRPSTALIVANKFLEAQVRELQAAVSNGYARGKFEPVPRDRKDWYD
jgi:hypothetical protein